jgi:RNA polymerase subunit RPABC4/transcription elongation factor Spt4
MPVCLHCGEIGPDGALFCGKCGYTLPQEGMSPPSAPPPRGPLAPGAATPAPGPPSAIPPARVSPPYAPVGAYAVPVGPGSGAVGPIPPPAHAKYCVRCATLIARAAVYCPVCQAPQP